VPGSSRNSNFPVATIASRLPSRRHCTPPTSLICRTGPSRNSCPISLCSKAAERSVDADRPLHPVDATPPPAAGHAAPRDLAPLPCPLPQPTDQPSGRADGSAHSEPPEGPPGSPPGGEKLLRPTELERQVHVSLLFRDITFSFGLVDRNCPTIARPTTPPRVSRPTTRQASRAPSSSSIGAPEIFCLAPSHFEKVLGLLKEKDVPPELRHTNPTPNLASKYLTSAQIDAKIPSQ